ncbi:MAG TPA: WD40 repeat domain-containing protein [Pseudolabrys sp.]
MTDREGITSITDRVERIDAQGVVAILPLGSSHAFVLGEEAVLLLGKAGPRRIAVHDGGILDAAGDGKRIVTGGDDGKVVALAADGTTQTIATDEKRRWIDHVALGGDGSVAWSCGKTVSVRAAKGGKIDKGDKGGDLRQRDMPSTPAGLAFLPKGFRLAVAHYNGVSLWFPNLPAEPETLAWKGSHLGLTVSPDGRFIVTAMQEPQLHGWRIADARDMRMSGYTARVRSMSWTADGAFLATGGSEQVILWPFSGKDGPMGKQPKLLAPAASRVTVVACHPREPVIATGFADGMVLLVRVDDGAEILVRAPGGGPVTALGWTAKGDVLAFGTEDEAGILPL